MGAAYDMVVCARSFGIWIRILARAAQFSDGFADSFFCDGYNIIFIDAPKYSLVSKQLERVATNSAFAVGFGAAIVGDFCTAHTCVGVGDHIKQLFSVS